MTIEGTEYVLRQTVVTIENEATCRWTWAGPITVGTCEGRKLEFSFDAQTAPHDPPYASKLVLMDADDNLLAQWDGPELEYHNCLEPITLTNSYSTCGTLADVTLTPEEWKTCCCYVGCRTGTPHQFQVSSIDNSSSWPTHPLTLDILWSGCDGGTSAQWYKEFPDAEFEGVTVNRALLDITNVSGGVGWRFQLYDVNDNTQRLVWQSATAISTFLPVDCEDVTVMRLPPTSGGAGPSTSDVALSPINIKVCSEEISGCDVNCCEAAYYSVLRGVGTLTDGQGWTYTTGSAYTMLPNEPYDPETNLCTYSHFGSWTKTGETPVAGEMRLEVARVVVYWFDSEGVFQGACLVTRPVKIKWLFGTSGATADMEHTRLLNRQECDGDENGTPLAPNTTCCDGTLTGKYIIHPETTPSPAISSLQYSAVF